MEINVSRFIAQNELAHVGDRFVPDMLSYDSIVPRAHDLHHEQDQKLEFDTESPPASIEESHCEAIGYGRAPDSSYGM
jgi:hypothetical protein